MVLRPWLQRRIAQHSRTPHCLRQWTAKQHFHFSVRRENDGVPNHYETLDLPRDASPGEIKKQFYKLSKSHHPDLHPENPSASQTFVKISEAYATLGSSEKKALYDRDFHRAHHQPAYSNHPSGSYSSAATPAGGRPASGLSRRRGQFRGPPPSFYRSGGWGEHSEKRAEHASNASHSHEAQGWAQPRPMGPAGTGPSGFTMGFDHDVPHFDQRGHYQTHSDIERTRHRARRKREVRHEDYDDGGGGGSPAFGAFVIFGVLVTIFGISGAVVSYGDVTRKPKNGGV